ncbi:MAG: PAS domain S-box protein [Methanobacterium sp.]
MVKDERWNPTIKERRQKGKIKVELTFKRKDGSTFPGEATSNLFTDADGTIKTSMIIRDISERKKAEEKLQESEERFRAVQENSIDRFTILKPFYDDQGEIIDFTYVYQNAQAAKTTGRRPEELIGLRMTEIWPTFPQTRFFAMYKLAVETGQLREFEERYHEDGVDDWFYVRITPIPGGIAIGTQIITEHKKAEKALHQSESYLRAVFENAAFGIAIGDMEGHVLDSNSTLGNMLGYSKDELKSKSFSEFTHPDDVNKEWLLMEDILAGKTDHYEIEKRYIRKDNTVIWVRLIGSLIKGLGGEPINGIALIEDITEHKKAEEEKQSLSNIIQAERDKLSALVNSIPDEVWFADTNKKFTLVNPSALQEFGLFSEEVDVENLAKSLEVYRPDGSPRPVEEAPPLRALKGEIVRNLEEIIRTPATNELRYRQVSASPVKDANGNIVGSVSVTRDITEIKKAEGELKRQAALLNVSYEAIFSWDYEGEILSWNKGAEGLYGYSSKEAIGQSSHGLLKTKFPVEFSEFMEELANDKIWSGELIHTTKDGNEIIIESRIQLITDTSGEKIVIETNRDITERKKLEDELRESRDNLEEKVEERTNELRLANIYNRSLIEASLDPLVTIGPNGRITDVNTATEQVTGYYKDELIGTDFSDYFTDPQNAKYGYQKVFREGEVRDYPLEIKHKNGQVTPVIYNASVYRDKSGYVIGVFAAARDITEIQQAENQLKQIITELERSNKELQSFAYITSHDLQEPLRSIASYAQLIKRRYEGQLDSDADDFIEYMVSGATRLQSMIKGLMEYSRLDTQGSEFKDFNSEEALNLALSNLKSSIDEGNVEVLHDNLPVIHADESQITRVFQNLIGNALKFRKKDVQPKIHIKAKKDAMKKEYVFSVQDNGIGMDKQYSDRIFEVFKRLHPIGEYEGTGIGLAIVKRIIERHGGHIWVESEFGVGSTFYFTIPVKTF